MLFFRKFKVGTRLLLFLLMMLLCILITTVFVSRYSAKQIADQYINQYLQAEHKRLVNSIELYMEEILMVSLRYKNNRALYDILKDPTLNHEQREIAFQAETAQIQPSVSGSISNVYIIASDGCTYLIDAVDEYLPTPQLSVHEYVDNSPYYHIGNIVRGVNGKCYLPLTMQFYNYHAQQNLGTLVFYLPQEPISQFYDELLSSSEATFIIDDTGAILSHSNSRYIETNIKNLGLSIPSNSFSVSNAAINNVDSIIISTAFSSNYELIGFPWHLVSILPYDTLYGVLDQILHSLIIAGIIVIIIACFISYFISSNLTRSLRLLREKIVEVSAGNIKAFLDSNPKDELWDLEQGYNEMLLRISDLLEKNKQEQEKKRELELIALQAQINPHFLYNTLDAIGWLAVLKGQQEIEQMVMELSRFFRLSLHKGDKLISIEDELGIAESYISIEQLRNPGKFDVEYDIQSDIAQLMIPKIILQPIVENAIKHGISQVRRHGHILIRGYRKNDDVYLEVSDNGNGFQQKSSKLHGNGYGLKNVNERIQLEYGPQYGLSIKSTPGEGTLVQVHLSFKQI